MLTEHNSPTESYVALDLETTGLDTSSDTVIEVGAVRFSREGVLETFHSLVNPYREIPPEVQALTGITQEDVSQAPPFVVVAPDLQAFVGSDPVVGHNVAFDLGVLEKHGVTFPGPALDTWDLAWLLLPSEPEYSLGYLARLLRVSHPRPHRALDDALATCGVFLKLLEMLEALGPDMVGFIASLAHRSGWPLYHALRGLAPEVGALSPGVDVRDLAGRLRVEERRGRPTGRVPTVRAMAGLLSPRGPFARVLPGYEARPQQVKMLTEVAQTLRNGGRLLVEAGTGVGKSLAYLVPAVLYSYASGRRVVVSTSTKNLQEQLVRKDIPLVVQALEEVGLLEPGAFRFALLKGRANYLCLYRWQRLARSLRPSVEEARLVAKVANWLRETATGEWDELNLTSVKSSLRQQVSVDQRGFCPAMAEGPCFLATARRRAEEAHLVVVNHSLLLADLVRGGNAIPDYDYLIVDEAHHLEDEATSQLGRALSQGWAQETVSALNRIGDEALVLSRDARLSRPLRDVGVRRVEELRHFLSRLGEVWLRLWGALASFLAGHREEGAGRAQVRLSPRARAGARWSMVELAWEDLHLALGEALRRCRGLEDWVAEALERVDGDWEFLRADVESRLDDITAVRDYLTEVVGRPADPGRVDWVEEGDYGVLTLRSAPLNVAEFLRENLFAEKRAVVLTSATLATAGDFTYVKGRLGLEDAGSILLGSPFDFRRSALLFIPSDMPGPEGHDYMHRLGRAVASLAREIDGRTLVLFTSYSAVRSAREALRAPLAGEGIRVLAQGVDGSPARIAREFAQNPRAVLLGTSSFWEGVDFPGDALRAVVIARLPFSVPTDPLFSARSSLFERPFEQYAVPLAVLRFRQGFGRLIRTAGDRGVVAVLDGRILTKRYGRAFLESLPKCTVANLPVSALARIAREWLEGRIPPGTL